MGCLKLTYNQESELRISYLNKELTLKNSAKNWRINYIYGYQGSEKDNEVKGSGNSYTTYFRQLDPRVGRWLTIDPKGTPWESPYVSMGNNPIGHNDVLGDKIKPVGDKKDVKSYIKTQSRLTGNKYKLDKDGFMINKRKYWINEKGTNKRRSGELSQITQKAINDDEIFELKIVRNDPKTLEDDYDMGTVDVGDISKMARVMKAGFIGHFLTERMENPGDYSISNRTDPNYQIAHIAGLEAESNIVTKMLNIPYSLAIQKSTGPYVETDAYNNVITYFFSTTQYGSAKYGFRQSANVIRRNGMVEISRSGNFLSRFYKIQ